MKILTGICFVVFAFGMQVAKAANVWHNNATVSRIYPSGSSASFVLKFTASGSCTNSNNYFYVTVGQNGVTEVGAKNLLATAMLGMSLGKQVSVIFDSASSYCYVNALFVDN